MSVKQASVRHFSSKNSNRTSYSESPSIASLILSGTSLLHLELRESKPESSGREKILSNLWFLLSSPRWKSSSGIIDGTVLRVWVRSGLELCSRKKSASKALDYEKTSSQITSFARFLFRILDRESTGFIFRVEHNTSRNFGFGSVSGVETPAGVVSALSQLSPQFRVSNSRLSDSPVRNPKPGQPISEFVPRRLEYHRLVWLSPFSRRTWRDCLHLVLMHWTALRRSDSAYRTLTSSAK